MNFKRLPAALTVALCSMLLVAVTSTDVAAQRGGGRGGPGGGGGFGGMMGNSSMSLLGDSKVAEELELDEEQVDALDELQGDMRDVFRETFSGMRERFREPDVDREALMEEIRDAIQEKMTTVDEKLEEVLLPHQMTRLSELTFQMQAQRGGTQGLLGNSKIKEELGLTDEQIEAVKEKAEEVKEQLEEKIAKARKDAQDEILSVLTPEQQTKIKEMLGESFAFEEGRGGFRGGRDGGRGGRDGGGRGGRDGGARGGRDGGGPPGGGARGGRGGREGGGPPGGGRRGDRGGDEEGL